MRTVQYYPNPATGVEWCLLPILNAPSFSVLPFSPSLFLSTFSSVFFLLRTSDGTGSANKIVRRDRKEWEGKKASAPAKPSGQGIRKKKIYKKIDVEKGKGRVLARAVRK